MTHFKTILLTAALIAVPSATFAQSSATNAQDYAKDKAVETVLDNATGEDAIVAGTTMIKGGSKTDAAVAVVKNRVDNKIDTMTDGAMDDAKDMAMDKTQGSSTTYTDGVPKETVQEMAAEKAPGSVMTYSDEAKTHGNSYGLTGNEKAKSLLTTGQSAVIPKSDMTTATTTSAAPVNCPAGTKDAGDGTCMITGDWNPKN